jgi:hypothetical protein
MVPASGRRCEAGYFLKFKVDSLVISRSQFIGNPATLPHAHNMQIPTRNAPNSLEDAAAQLQRSMEAARRSRHSLHELRAHEREILRAWAASHQRVFLQDPTLSLERRQQHGEHVVGYHPQSSCWWKMTHPGKTGVGAGFHYDSLPPFAIHGLSARELLPSEYLDRLILHNEEFGDDIRLEGFIDLDAPSLLISQPDISGTPATLEEMDNQMRIMGYLPLNEISLGKPNSVSFYQPVRRIAVFDAHPGNFFAVYAATIPVDGILTKIQHPSEHAWLMERIVDS